MSDRSGALAIKFRHIIAPTIGSAILFACGYSLLNWLLVARSDLIPVDETVAQVGRRESQLGSGSS